MTCLTVNGNQAVAGFAGTVSPAGFPQAPFVAALRITDAASPGPFEDAIVFQTLTGPAPTDCSLIPPPNPQSPTEAVMREYSTVVVHDAQPPAPTSKAQCKDGGWQQFGFKNQGQCIAFVNRAKAVALV